MHSAFKAIFSWIHSPLIQPHTCSVNPPAAQYALTNQFSVSCFRLQASISAQDVLLFPSRKTDDWPQCFAWIIHID